MRDASGRGNEPIQQPDALRLRVLAILARRDPLGLIRMGAPEGEYAPEARTIVPRLGEAASVADVRRIVHEEFVYWFGTTAGAEELYTDIAEDLWQARRDQQAGGDVRS